MALKSIAQMIGEEVRLSDISSRMEGDVFAVLFPETTGQQAISAVERIRVRVKDHYQNELTISTGLIDGALDIKNERDCIETARQALSLAKQRGGDMIIRHAEDTTPAPSETNDGHILIVDDDAKNLKLLEAMLRTRYSLISTASNGESALRILNEKTIDVVLLDVMMPGIDGFEVCRRIRSNPETRLMPVVLITALDDTGSKIKGLQAGANDFLTKPPNRQELIARTGSLVTLRQVTSKLAGIENVLFSLARSIEAKDPYTKGHTERVANIAVHLGQRLSLSSSDIEALRYGGYLHDIGKIGTPMEVLHKPGKLDDSEWNTIRKHPMDGYHIALPLHRVLGKALDVVRYHHERLDGSGYPDGLSGEDIPMLARILAVADAFDAMTTDRPYRPRMDEKKVVAILKDEAAHGKLDDQVVEEMINMIATVQQTEAL